MQMIVQIEKQEGISMKLMVLDGNSIINRAYYGIRPLSTRQGLFTHAVYGFLTTMQRLTEEEEPDALCVTFDRREPTFRHLADASYKAQRKGMPEELAMQLPWIKKVLDAMNIPRYELAGYEADDLIGTISRRCEAAGWQCVVVTGDKDSLQLITDQTTVKLVSTRMGQTTTKDMTPAAFREQYGFEPIHLIDLKALMGDTSDNISGVPGVGEKTAMALIGQYHTIEKIYELLPDIDAKPAAKRHLAEGKESAEHSKFMATIVTDVPMEFKPEDNLRRPFKPELYDILLELEFSKLIDKYSLRPAGTAAAESAAAAEAEEVVSREQAEKLLKSWRGADFVTVLASPDLQAVAVEWAGDGSGMAQMTFEKYKGDWNALLRALFSADIPKVSHNVKDLQHTLLENGLPADGFIYDTAIAAYLLDATAGSYDLQRLYVAYYNEELPKPIYLEEDAFSLLGDHEEAAASLCAHCSAVAALKETTEKKLREYGMWELFTQVEMPLCKVLAKMELAGFRVDAAELAAFGERLAGEMKTLESRIYEAAGSEFNINSPKQLGKVLFDDLQLPHGKKTKTGWSTSADVLEKLRWQNPIVEDVLQFRQLSKLKSTYADGLLKVIGPDGRVRTSFQMTVTATGRLSSTEPNLQNIPTRTELGSQMRKMFVADPGCVLVDADYSQIELRLLAHMADDRVMQEAFRSGADFHTVTAAKVFHVPEAEVTHQMRSRAKAVNFGIVYGISAFSLSRDIGVTVAEAKDYMDRYFATYTGVKNYMDHIIEKAREQTYVETLMHRRRDLPELKSSNFNLRSFGERVALNMPIQGTAADIMKLAMVRVDRELTKEKLRARLIMQVHDELIVECPEEEQSRVEELLTREMEQVVSLTVPLSTEAHSGRNWLEAKE